LVRSVAFSPDGRSFVSASDDCTLRVWNAVTSTEQRTLQGHFRSVTSVAFSPDSHRLVSGSDDMTVRIWNMATGMQEQTLNGHTGSVRSVAFSLDSRWLASGSADKTVRVWDAKTGKLFRQLEDHPKWVWSVTFSPSGHWLASASDSTVRVWDISTGMLNQTLCGHTDWVRSVAFSPDGHWFASASDDRSLRVWDAATDISRIKSLFFPGRIGKLCETCKNLDIVTVSNQQISLENLKQQSKKHWRCQMCAVFWRCLEALLGPETPLLYKTLIINHFEGEQRGPLRADLIPHDPGRVRKIRLQFFPDIGTIFGSCPAMSM
jgi:WD40 repeat protein